MNKIILLYNIKFWSLHGKLYEHHEWVVTRSSTISSHVLFYSYSPTESEITSVLGLEP